MKKILMMMVVVAALMMPSLVRADSITPFYFGPATGGVPDGGGFFDYTYFLTLSSPSFAESGAIGSTNPTPAMFQFFDFNGVISVDMAGMPAGWVSSIGPAPAFSVAMPAATPTCLLVPITPCPPDDPSIDNVLIGHTSGAVFGPGGLIGSVVVKSIYGFFGSQDETYFSQDTKGVLCDDTPDVATCFAHPDAPAGFGFKPADFSDTTRIQTNFGLYTPPAAAIPEPASLFLLGTGLLGLGSRLRKKNKKENTPSV